MANVTLHKNCLLTPATLNVNHADNVSFQFNNAGTLLFTPASFFGQGSLTGATATNTSLPVKAPVNNSVTVTVQSGTCTPTGTSQKPGPDDGDSCVITVTSPIVKKHNK